MTEKKIDDGGAAGAKTLLDEFAGQALAGLLGHPTWWVDSHKAGVESGPLNHFGEEDRLCAEHAYWIAAAMIAEKRRRESGGAE